MKRILASSIGLLMLSGAALAADPGITDTEIKIGDVNILTGPASFIGRAVSLGSKIAAAEVNAAGGIHGRQNHEVARDAQRLDLIDRDMQNDVEHGHHGENCGKHQHRTGSGSHI